MSSGFSFGSQTPTPLGGSNTPQFSFGSNQQSGGFQLGAGTTPSSAGNFILKPTGSVAPTIAPAFGTSAPSSFPGLGQTTTSIASASTSGFTFGAPATSTVSTLGIGNISSAAPTLSFGTAATTAGPSLNFGTPAVSSVGLSFGAPTPTATTGFGAAPLGFGLPANPPASNVATSALGFNLSSATAPVASTEPSTKIGLGGIPTTSQSTPGAQQLKEVPPKEQPIPNEILQDIEAFKNFIKQQKLYSSDVARCSIKDFRAVGKDIEQLNNGLKEIETQLGRNRALAEKLKFDAAEGLQWLEMAQRTQDTPPGLQFDNTAPTNFFLSLADRYEKEMHALKMQIESTDKYLRNCGQPVNLTSQDLSNGMRRLHDTFVALAGRLQSVHSQVESQKEMFLNLRKHLTNDPTNPFEKLESDSNLSKLIAQRNVPVSLPQPKITCGPTPFNAISNGIRFPATAQQSPIKMAQSVGTSTTGFSFGASSTPPTTSLFGNSSFSIGNSSSFQLQRPPIGNKRKQ